VNSVPTRSASPTIRVIRIVSAAMRDHASMIWRRQPVSFVTRGVH
jgi:hypothetical protein